MVTIYNKSGLHSGYSARPIALAPPLAPFTTFVAKIAPCFIANLPFISLMSDIISEGAVNLCMH
jgi:hypothetical protein